MTKNIYQVASTIQVEGGGKGRYLALKPLFDDPFNTGMIHLKSDAFTVGDHIEISLQQVSADSLGPAIAATASPADDSSKSDPATFFLHHYDRKNMGDVLSGPYNYFKFQDVQKISWDESIIGDKPTDFAAGMALF